MSTNSTKNKKNNPLGLSQTIIDANQTISKIFLEVQDVAKNSSNLPAINEIINEGIKEVQATTKATENIATVNKVLNARLNELRNSTKDITDHVQVQTKGIRDFALHVDSITSRFDALRQSIMNTSKYIEALQNVHDEITLEQFRVNHLGKKGDISLELRKLGAMDPNQRKEIAPLLNGLKGDINQAISQKKQELFEKALEEQLQQEWLDVTLPGRARRQGTIHPVSQTIDQAVAIFSDMGFSYAEGPQVETDWYNFDALNIPPEHPARQEHDTFFVKSDTNEDKSPNVLRTHTSPVQIRSMTRQGVPIRIIAPGRVYRCDYDQTHTPMFHQIEGLAIDKNLNMAHLKWTLEEFCRTFFEVDNAELRFRASHFPFTEPSAEVDIRCSWEKGQLKIGEGSDWLEILGCGMVHPNVLTACGVDKTQYQGFAFGMGLDRIAMLKYGIPDLRSFFESDIRWLRHYGFLPVDVPSLHSGLSL